MLLHDIVRMNSYKDVTQDYFIANGTDNYFNTGIIPNENTITTMVGSYYASNKEQYSGLIGGGIGRYYFGVDVYSKWRLGYSSNTVSSSIDVDFNNHEKKIESGKLFIDDLLVSDKSSLTLESLNTFYVFKLNGTGLDYYSYFKLFKFEMLHNGILYSWKPNKEREVIEKYIDGIYQNDITINGTVLPSQFGSEVI